jgi:hypothetical protein
MRLCTSYSVPGAGRRHARCGERQRGLGIGSRRKSGRPAIVVSVAGIAVPFLLGLALGEALPDSLLPSPSQRLITALFLGTALSISSVKIVAMVVRDLGVQRRNIGQIMMASSILDDTIAWIVIAIISSIAIRGAVDLHGVLTSVVGTAIFLAVSFTVGRQVVFRLIRWTNDTFVSEMPVISVILAIMGIMALATDAIGVQTVLGAFVAGMLGWLENCTAPVREHRGKINRPFDRVELVILDSKPSLERSNLRWPQRPTFKHPPSASLWSAINGLTRAAIEGNPARC